jgi:hypothetical protein
VEPEGHAPRALRAPAAPSVRVSEVLTPKQIKAVSHSPCPSTPRTIVDVRDFGALGNGLADDTKAIQKADSVVAAHGGGQVVFSPGVYRALGVQQDSCVEFTSAGTATLVHPDGTSAASVVESRLVTTKGSIGRSSRVLRVTSTKGIRPGVVVAIQGAGGMSSIQRTELKGDAAPYVEVLTVNTTHGLQRHWRSYLFVGNEIVSYDGINGQTLLNVKRGLFGTAQTYHKSGTAIGQAQRLYAVVVAVSRNSVSLDRRAPAGVTNASVNIGSVGMSINGLAIDGNRRPNGSAETNPFPVLYRLARFASVRNSTITNGDHGGIAFDTGTRDSIIERNNLADNGDPAHHLGAGVWLFRGATRNLVRHNVISGNTFIGVFVDDRTETASDYDADAGYNRIESNTIGVGRYGTLPWNAGIVITGSTHTQVTANMLSDAVTGIMVAMTKQGTHPSSTYSNSVRHNTFARHLVGIRVSGSDNEFVWNVIRQSQDPTQNSGDRNRFVHNTVEG